MAASTAPLRSRTALVVALVTLLGAPVGCAAPGDGGGGPPTAPDPAPTRVQAPEGPPEEAPVAVTVARTAVGESSFGDPREDTVSALTEHLGEPDLQVPPQQFEQVDDRGEWYESADDQISPRWAHPVFSATCWDGLCVMFGGPSTAELALRGWELSTYNRWSPEVRETGAPEPGVVLAGSEITLGDPWTALHAAYPTTRLGWAEGGTLGVEGAPWRTIFDGVDGWRVSGYADRHHPDRAPDDAVVTRLSAGEGPEPGCC